MCSFIVAFRQPLADRRLVLFSAPGALHALHPVRLTSSPEALDTLQHDSRSVNNPPVPTKFRLRDSR